MGPPDSSLDQSRLRNHRFDLRRAQHADHDADGHDRSQAARQRCERGMEPRRSFATRCQPGTPVYLPLPAGQRDHLGRLRLRRKRFAEQKCLALRIGSYLARKQGWLAEHMLILGVESPEGRKALRGCGVPERVRQNQFRHADSAEAFRRLESHDSRRRHRLDADSVDGRLYAVNPENGYFGVVPGTSYKSNPNAMKSIERDTLYTNVALTDDGDVWWEGKDGAPPAHAASTGKETTGRPIRKKKQRIRTAVSPRRCATIRCSIPMSRNGEGVPISAIIFGGRRSDTMPLVFQAFDWEPRRLSRRDHGFGDNRGRNWRCRPGSPRSDGDAAFLRLQHGRLFSPLARHRAAPDESAAYL